MPADGLSESRFTSCLTYASALAFLATLTLSGCGLVQDMQEGQKKSDSIAASLEKELGVKPLVGWNITNGTLTYVNVTFPLAAVSKLPVGELEAKVRAVVVKDFEKPPEQLIVSVSSRQ